VVEALLRTASIAADDLAFIDAVASRLRGKVARREGEAVILDRKGFHGLHPALKRHLLRAGIEELLGNLKDIESRHIEEIMGALDKPAGKTIVLPDGLTFTIEYDRYLLGSDPSALSPFPPLDAEAELNVPGTTSLPGWDIEAEITTPAEVKAGDADAFTAYFDFEKVGGRLTVRRRRLGDRLQPLGMRAPKKLNEFMIDAKIPQSWRRHIPIVSSPRQVLWVVGWRLDERVRVSDGTRRVLRLKFTRR
jgi:tRNA(Ile)-lysidine synthase